MPLTTFARPTSRNPQRLFWDILRDPNLVMLHLLNETSGTTAYDRCTRNNIDGTMVNTPTLGVALGNGFNGMTFAPASSEYINLGTPSGLAFNRTDPFSVVYLGKFNDDAENKIVVGRQAGTGFGGWHFGLGTTELMRFQFVDNGDPSPGVILVVSDAALATATLHMPGMSYSGSGAATGVVFYNNGAVVADTDSTDTMSTNPVYTATTAYIGAKAATPDSFWNGTLGLVAVFNAAKSANDFSRWAKLAGQI